MASVAAGIAISFAASAVASVLTPKPKSRGSLEDLSVLKSELGVSIPKIYGRSRVTGNVFWAIDNQRDSGRSRGKGSSGQEEDKIIANFAVMLCEGRVDDIGKIWFNNKLVYNPFSEDSATVAKSAEFAADHMEIYYGTSTQAESPTIQSYESGSIPAFRRRCYIVFRELNITDYGSVPKVEVEIIANSYPPSLRFVLDNVLLTKTSLSNLDYDVTALDGIQIDGVILPQDGSSVRDFIEDLQQIYHFITKEVAGKLIFQRLDQELTPIDIETKDLGVREYGDSLPSLYIESRIQDLDLPSEISIDYNNSENSYQRGNQRVFKASATHDNPLNIKTNTAINDSQALTACKKSLEYYWEQRRKYTGIFLDLDYLHLQPGDLINLPIRGNKVLAQIQSKNVGANTIIELECVSYSEYVNSIAMVAPTAGTYNPVETVANLGNPTALLLDIPLVRDTDEDIGLYGTAIADPNANRQWNGGTMFAADSGGEFGSVASLPNIAAIGTLTTELGAGNPYSTDRTSRFRVRLDQGELNNITDTEFFNFQQMGYLNGELLVFQNAQLVEENEYEISVLIRGVRGTENAIANHSVGSQFILVRGDDGCIDIPGDTPTLGIQLDFKAVPAGAAQTAITNETQIIATGQRLKPYAPAHPRIVKKANNDLYLKWIRRTRKNGYWLSTSETVPLNEDAEVYDLEIYNGVDLVRTVTITSPSYLYTSGDQVTDFGSNQSQLTFKIFQVSALLGRGSALEMTNLSISRIEV
ncbi:MAG: phage tail protein [Xenococcus sp. (in: cyanobacteria)]